MIKLNMLKQAALEAKKVLTEAVRTIAVKTYGRPLVIPEVISRFKVCSATTAHTIMSIPILSIPMRRGRKTKRGSSMRRSA